MFTVFKLVFEAHKLLTIIYLEREQRKTVFVHIVHSLTIKHID